MSAPVRVCPLCGEHDDQPEFWTPKCEKAVAELGEWYFRCSKCEWVKPHDTVQCG